MNKNNINSDKPTKLILGIGNEILTDDGIGPKLVSKLEKEDPIADIEYKNVFLGGLDILDLVRDYEKVVFIDAIKTKDGKPGTVYTYTPDDFKETLHLSNFHDTSFLTALELGKQLGIKLPEEIHIIAIEIVEDLIFSDQFSTEISRRFDYIYNSVNKLVTKLI